MGRSAEGIEHAERAIAIAESLQEPMLRIAARHPLGRSHQFLGAYRTAIDFYQRDVGLGPEQISARLLEPSADEVFEAAFIRYSYLYTDGDLAACFAELGAFDEAMLHAERAMKFAQTLDILVLHAYADAYLGSVHLRRGELRQALHLAQRWLQTYAAAELPMPQLHMAETLGEVFNISGHIDEAITLLGGAWEFAHSKSIFAHGPQVLALLGDAHGRAGRIDEAVATGQRALDLANQIGQRATKLAPSTCWATFTATARRRTPTRLESAINKRWRSHTNLGCGRWKRNVISL
jgi:tetratricopeptide (TPR) repeat protein